MVGLNLACGRDYREGWVNIDNRQMYHGDFKVDMEADVFTLEWESDSVDYILVSHFIQYVTPDKLDVLLKRWYGWLKEGGSIYIEAGNVLAVCETILQAKSVYTLHGKNGIMQLYGIDDNIWNKWAWCPASLTEAMDRAGYKGLFTGPGHFHYNKYRDFLTVGYKGDFAYPPVPYLLKI